MRFLLITIFLFVGNDPALIAPEKQGILGGYEDAANGKAHSVNGTGSTDTVEEEDGGFWF